MKLCASASNGTVFDKSLTTLASVVWLPQSLSLMTPAVGGVSAAVSKTAAAPIERVKLLIQNQVRDYLAILDCSL